MLLSLSIEFGRAIIISLALLLVGSVSFAQERAILKKCIKSYREQFVEERAIQTEAPDLKKMIATYMILDGFDFQGQTDTSITFSQYNEWGREVYVEPTWDDALFMDPYYYFNQTKLGLVTITIGWYHTKEGMDIWAESNFRAKAYSDPRTCVMFNLYKPLRNYLFRNLDGRQPDWPEELLSAVNSYNAERENPRRRLNPNAIY